MAPFRETIKPAKFITRIGPHTYGVVTPVKVEIDRLRAALADKDAKLQAAQEREERLVNAVYEFLQEKGINWDNPLTDAVRESEQALQQHDEGGGKDG